MIRTEARQPIENPNHVRPLSVSDRDTLTKALGRGFEPIMIFSRAEIIGFALVDRRDRLDGGYGRSAEGIDCCLDRLRRGGSDAIFIIAAVVPMMAMATMAKTAKAVMAQPAESLVPAIAEAAMAPTTTPEEEGEDCGRNHNPDQLWLMSCTMHLDFNSHRVD